MRGSRGGENDGGRVRKEGLVEEETILAIFSGKSQVGWLVGMI